MKKIIATFFIACSLQLAAFSFSYTPTPEDTQRTENLIQVLDEYIDGDKEILRSFYSQILDIEDFFLDNERMAHKITTIRDHLHDELQTMKMPHLLNGRLIKEEFVRVYEPNIIKEHSIPQRCRDRWQYLDDISFVHNLPTAITMATRYAESTCGFYLPVHPVYGSNGPFQIITKDYGTGEMTEPLFRQTVKDFIDFTWSKINNYERANRNDQLKVNLSYSSFDFTGVVRFGALYNGLANRTIRGDIQPMKRWYVFNNYEPEYADAVRHGLMPMFIKTLERELENVYPAILGTGVVGMY